MTDVAVFDKEPVYSSPSCTLLLDKLALTVQDKVVLDLGCGDGRVCFTLLQRGARFCSGVDFSKVRIHMARQAAQERGRASQCDFLVDDIQDYTTSLQEAGCTVDIVCLFNVLQHTAQPSQLLQGVRQVTRHLLGCVSLAMLPLVESVELVRAAFPEAVFCLDSQGEYLYFCG